MIATKSLESQVGNENAVNKSKGTNTSSQAATTVGSNGLDTSELNDELLLTRTEDIKSTHNLSFEQLGLKKEIIKAAVNAFHWKNPSPIQEKLIPIALDKKNVIARSKNGTGKTGSFILPIMNMIDVADKSTIEALVIVPTRELAMQTSALFINIARHLNIIKNAVESQEQQENGKKTDKNSTSPKELVNRNLAKVILLNGGNPIVNQIVLLKAHKQQGVKIVVGTPGRIHDLAKKNQLPLDKLKVVVLDEADRLLSENVADVVKNILSMCPKTTQTLMVSATYPSDVQKIIQETITEPVMINNMNELALKGITNYYCNVEEKDKIRALNTMFQALTVSQAIIFVSSAVRAMVLNNQLQKCGYSTTCIHSQMNQLERKQVFNDFKTNNSHRILVCTDIFERGIDNTRVNVVINFDLPRSSHHYLHRTGRAGRYGRKGITIDIVNMQKHQIAQYAKIMQEIGIAPQPVPKKFDEELYKNE